MMIDCANFSSKVRWTIEGQFKDVSLPPIFCKLLSSTKNSITTKIWTCGGSEDHPALFAVLHQAYDASNTGNPPFKGNLISKMWNSNGELFEEWYMEGVWPKSFNFGDPGYSTSPDVEMEIVWIFDKCTRKEKQLLPLTNIMSRKYRWTVSGGKDDQELVKPMFVKLQKRPTINVEEATTPDGNWTVAKSQWFPLTFTVCNTPWEICEGIYKCNWLKLHLYDGCGYLLEEFELKDATMTNFQFFDLDHSSTSLPDVEFTFQFKNTIYKNHYPQIKP